MITKSRGQAPRGRLASLLHHAGNAPESGSSGKSLTRPARHAYNSMCSRRRTVNRVDVPPAHPFGPLAQLAEHRTFNPQVVGSNPTGPTNYVPHNTGRELEISGCRSDSPTAFPVDGESWLYRRFDLGTPCRRLHSVAFEPRCNSGHQLARYASRQKVEDPGS